MEIISYGDLLVEGQDLAIAADALQKLVDIDPYDSNWKYPPTTPFIADMRRHQVPRSIWNEAKFLRDTFNRAEEGATGDLSFRVYKNYYPYSSRDREILSFIHEGLGILADREIGLFELPLLRCGDRTGIAIPTQNEVDSYRKRRDLERKQALVAKVIWPDL